MKKLIIAAAVIIPALIVAAVILFRDSDFENAVDQFESGDYDDALVELNRLIPLADYETAEKIYYYRCKSINRLAERLEEKYDDELASLAFEKKASAEFDEAKSDVERGLETINKRTDGDLALIIQKKKGRIASRGRFYNEFLSKYKGSPLLEDLDFEEVQRLSRTDPDSHIGALINFYGRYPNTGYLSQIVTAIMEGLQQNRIGFTPEKKETLWGIISSYVRRYPTSPVTGRLFTSNADNVNLRNSPGLQGDRVGKLAKDEIVIQMEKSMDSSQVGDVRAHWYRITSLSGTRGWIFGKFLTPLDISTLKADEIEEKWSMEERFAEWTDSNTPKSWMHVEGADKASIGFAERPGGKVAIIDSPAGKSAGLYTRFGASKAFTLMAKARFIEGNGVTVIGYCMGGASFYVKLSDETVNVTGRTIPAHTADWHEYTLVSADGKYATLAIDGEVVSGRITPVAVPGFANRGVYCLVAGEKDTAKAEMEYIKIK